jgi:hypothetical protein
MELPFYNYVVFVIGANHKKRKWSLENYISIAKQLYSFGYSVVLCGNEGEIDDALWFEKHFGNTYIDLVGQTSLIDMLSILNRAKFVVSNDTGLAHMSIALKKKTFIISNGNHFGRFVPYPKEYNEHVQCIFPFDYQTDFKSYCEKYYNNSDVDINLVTADLLFEYFKIDKRVDNSMVIYNSFNAGIIKNNYIFKFYREMINLKGRVVIYGNGTMGREINALLPEMIDAFIDKKSDLISRDIVKGGVYSPNNLPNMQYDKIIISVVGREDEIIKYLTQELNVEIDKIMTLNI